MREGAYTPPVAIPEFHPTRAVRLIGLRRGSPRCCSSVHRQVTLALRMSLLLLGIVLFYRLGFQIAIQNVHKTIVITRLPIHN